MLKCGECGAEQSEIFNHVKQTTTSPACICVCSETNEMGMFTKVELVEFENVSTGKALKTSPKVPHKL